MRVLECEGTVELDVEIGVRALSRIIAAALARSGVSSWRSSCVCTRESS